MKKALSITAFAAAASFVLAGCGGGGDSTAEAGDLDLVQSGKLTVCSDIPYEPFEFVKDGKTVGFDIDLADKLAERLELETEVLTTPFEGIQSGTSLDTGKCDIAISGISITDDRKTKMEFTDPYLNDNLGLAAAKSDGFKSLDDVKDKKVGVQAATTGETYAKDKGISPVQYETGGMMTQALMAGKVDAAVGNISVISAATKADDKLELVETYDTGEQLGAAAKKDNTKLTEEFNAMLKEMLENGEYDELVQQWFGDEVAESLSVAEGSEG
ncbi:ABC transporter substrate-binding protein [Brevibacterium sp. HMSC24B04]|uniref:ABC transporter substrate-binding protein n=1 Tax=Brevibacterium sp. HMSC24B04 TaxID=1581060 RepID=UPI0008A5CE97|nr:ABC transporter substrate-binding protein [Brevibacterium sp. HMSC24B04]OFT93023.1 ABC transporter substrate-binding protein [Brevibacterium sp. HMSC24B04]